MEVTGGTKIAILLTGEAITTIPSAFRSVELIAITSTITN
jgi:hypothetical protein